MTEVCYSDHADKRDKWPRLTLPAIMQAARDAVHVLDERTAFVRWMQQQGIQTAEELHDMVRALPYVPNPRRACDAIQPVTATIRNGGDCDQCAAVVLAGLRVLGFNRLWLVVVGDDLDPYMHVHVCMFAAGRYWTLDPKPDQIGAPFNQRSDNYPRATFYAFQA